MMERKSGDGCHPILGLRTRQTIDGLTDDALLIVFSSLTIRERIGSASRVCKRWNRLLKVGAIWRHIDLWEWVEVLPASVRRHRKLKKPYTRRQKKLEAPARISFELRPLIKKEKQALKFLRTYVSGSLRTLNLCIASDSILQFLRDNCPQVETLSLGSSFEYKEFLPTAGVRTTDLSLMPNSVVKLKVQSGWAERGRIVPPNSLDGLAKDPFPNLKELVLERHVAFPTALFRRLSRCTGLRSLSLISFERINELSMGIIAKRLTGLEELCLQSCIRESLATNKVLQQIAKNMTQLATIKLRSGPTYPDEQRSIDVGLGSLRACKKLQHVWIENICSFSIVGFTSLAKGLPNLQEVVLIDCGEVTDSFLGLIQQQLKNLTLLRLERCPKLTDFGMKHLICHPSLEHLEIVGKLQTTRVFPTPKIICDIAESIDKLKILKVLITGHPPTDLLKPHFLELKKMCPDMDIVVWLRPDVKVDIFQSICNSG